VDSPGALVARTVRVVGSAVRTDAACGRPIQRVHVVDAVLVAQGADVAGSDDAAASENGDSVRVRVDEVEVVRTHDDRGVGGGVRGRGLERPLAHPRIEPAGRLVEDDQRGVAGASPARSRAAVAFRPTGLLLAYHRRRRVPRRRARGPDRHQGAARRRPASPAR